MCSAIDVTLNPGVPFSCQRMYLGIFLIYCIPRDNSLKIEHLAMLLLDASGVVTKLIDVFNKFMNKESVLISILGYISDACSAIDIRVETIHTVLSR